VWRIVLFSTVLTVIIEALLVILLASAPMPSGVGDPLW
jgi:hypothetical protein